MWVGLAKIHSRINLVKFMVGSGRSFASSVKSLCSLGSVWFETKKLTACLNLRTEMGANVMQMGTEVETIKVWNEVI